MTKLRLANGTEIVVESGSSITSVVVVFDSKEAMLEAWDALTADNLAAVQIVEGDETVVGEYTDLVLVSESSVVQTDGTVHTTFRLRKKTEVELLREKMAALEEGLAVHDEAISDLGAAVSDIAGGV